MSEVRLINNMKGVLYHMDMPLLDFEIKDRELVGYKNLSNGKMFPPELAVYGITYGNINEFFQRRTMKEGCMFYHEHLAALGLDKMDFERYIMMNNGNNNVDLFWVRFDDFGAKSFDDILNQDYPVC